jgi:hypothetical protein
LNNTFDFSFDFSLIHEVCISFYGENFKPENSRKESGDGAAISNY